MSTTSLRQALAKPKARAPRRSYRRPIGVMVLGKYEICESLVLSENGILFVLASSTTVEIGALLLCTLIMPNGVSLILKAKVVYQKKVNGQIQVGAGFLNIDPVGRRKVRNYVAAKTVEEANNDALDGTESLPPTSILIRPN